ncbi:LLM class flavin-dependent oxidoreductase [Hyphomicrobium methylovorum]|uniref:LLM class flavin-dependent oxidoreductase n=1 Tax=Hyphomicrobium methylovorum TaxID=84 RepID=UPI0015E7CCD7|nr:LLM class flavin-dependent oxidoreductase [Hyphomicrobium methylovorum]MBA2124765.1 LLM class flavin-dependent oxidoreductase [Hyphomicrobium methylovorum]
MVNSADTDRIYGHSAGISSENSQRKTRLFRIGLSGCAGGLEAISSSNLLDLAEKAEALGFDGLWLNEEHFQGSVIEVEGRRCHSPLILASAILARTRTLRVGFSVLLLALHHPVRLAEEIATLDVISDGRVDFGISRGGNGRYLEVYGVDPDSVNERFQSTLTFLQSAWQDGKMPFGENAYSIEPKPIQKPHPPIFIGTYSDETAAWAAREGHALICHGINSMANQRRILRAFTDAGGDAGQVPFGRFVYVSETDASAREELWPTVLNLTGRLKGFGIFNRKGIIAEQELEPEAFYREMVIAGSPETCSRRILELNAELGITYLNALSAFFGFLPLDLLNRSLTLLARDVQPLVEKGLMARARA